MIPVVVMKIDSFFAVNVKKSDDEKNHKVTGNIVLRSAMRIVPGRKHFLAFRKALYFDLFCLTSF